MGGVAQRRESGVFRVGRQRRPKIGPLLVELEAGRRGSVGFHRRKHFRQSGKTTLGEFQLLEELPDAAISRRYGRDPSCRCQVLEINSRNRTRIAHYLNPAGIQIDLGWVPVDRHRSHDDTSRSRASRATLAGGN